MTPCWRHLCDVDIEPLLAWLESARIDWPRLPSPDKPQRVRPPEELARPIIDSVLARLGVGLVADDVVLSRVMPGQTHPLHTDRQRSDWLTRVHVPLVTNPGAWMLFEDERAFAHFEAGKAYSFDALRRHAFGNGGDEARVHLIFDVLRWGGGQ